MVHHMYSVTPRVLVPYVSVCTLTALTICHSITKTNTYKLILICVCEAQELKPNTIKYNKHCSFSNLTYKSSC